MRKLGRLQRWMYPGCVVALALTLTASLAACSDALSVPAEVTGAGTLSPMPLISTGVHAFGNPGSYSAARANDSAYTTVWRANVAPSTAAPDYLAYDLSTVPVSQRAQVVVDWHNDVTYNYFLQANDRPYNLPRDYAIETNAAPGGASTAPTTGWVKRITVTGNMYNARAYSLSLQNSNWLRISVTASNGSAQNMDVALRMDVHDTSHGAQDSWLMLGDSITNGAFKQSTGVSDASGGDYPQLIQKGTGASYFPMVIDGGVGNTTMAWASEHRDTLLSGLSGGYAVIAYGSNDANVSHALSSAEMSAYYDNLLSVIDALPAGVIPVVPTIPWGCGNGGMLATNAHALNTYVSAHLTTDRPQAIRGPDLWTFFEKNQAYISSDCLHPTHDPAPGKALSGYEAYIHTWSEWAIRYIYGMSTTNRYLLPRDDGDRDWDGAQRVIAYGGPDQRWVGRRSGCSRSLALSTALLVLERLESRFTLQREST